MSLADEIAPGADGLSQLRALMASGRKPGILAALQFELVEAELGRAVFAGVPGEHAYNPIGTVHGELNDAGIRAGHSGPIRREIIFEPLPEAVPADPVRTPAAPPTPDPQPKEPVSDPA